MNFNPRYFKKISIADISTLKDHFLQIPKIGVKLNDLSSFKLLPVVGLIAVQVVSKQQDNQVLYTTNVTFELPEKIKTDTPHVYLLETIIGTKYIIGSPDHPYCRTIVEDQYPSKTSEKSVCKVTVEIIDKNGLMLVL